MTYDSAVAFDSVDQNAAQHEVVFNGNLNAISEAFLFGINQRLSNGLVLTLYGGNWPQADGSILPVATQTIRLTASATNYLYATVAGVVTKVTSAPTGWPGPLASSSRALYSLVVGANSITSGTNYLMGGGLAGPVGPTGPQGPAGNAMYLQRQRIATTAGNGSTNVDLVGFDITTSMTAGPNARSLGSTFFGEGVPFFAFGGTGIGGSGQIYSARNFWFLGNAAGRGGFDVSFRWSFDSTFNSTTARRFIGLYNVSAGVFGNVEPDTVLNTIGVGSKAGDANLSVIHNDGSGTATMIALGANFPARVTDNVYELRLVSVANSGTVQYTIVDAATGNTASGTISTNLPANTQFLGWYLWTNTGTNSTTTLMNFMQVTGNSRY